MSDYPEPAPQNPAPWEAVTCVRCGEEFMFQHLEGERSTGTACPHCGAPTDLSTRYRDSPGEFAPLITPGGLRTRSRRKRKVHSEEDLGWEAGEAGTPEKQGQVSEYLTSSPNHPDEVRLKRVRRKKLPTRWEKLSAKFSIWTKLGIVAGTGIMIYFAIRTLFVVAATDTDPALQPRADLGPDPATLDGGGVPTIVTPEDEAACIAVGNAFYAAATVEEKLPHVSLPQRVRPLMEKWYETHGDSDGQIAEVILKKKYPLGERRFIQLAVGFTGGSQRFIVFEQDADGKVRLEWEVSVGYQPMPIAEFMRTKPTAAIPFRVKVLKEQDYHPPFQDRERYQSLRLTYPGNREFQLTGYVERGTDWAAAFLATLEFDQAPSVILALRYPENASSDTHVEVVELVHDSWFYTAP